MMRAVRNARQRIALLQTPKGLTSAPTDNVLVKPGRCVRCGADAQRKVVVVVCNKLVISMPCLEETRKRERGELLLP